MPHEVKFGPSGELTRFACTVTGNPGAAKVNGWKTPILIGRSIRIVEGKSYRGWKKRAAVTFRLAASGRQFDDGPLRATITAYWPRQAKTGAAKGLAFGDVDAVAKAALDALEAAGVVEDDAQIVEVHLSKSYSAAEPRIEVEVMRA